LGLVTLPQGLCYTQQQIRRVICANKLPNIAHGNFALENSGGSYNLVYYPYGWSCNATTIPITCLSFCEYSSTTIRDVLSSSFNVYDDDWPFEESRFASNATEASNFGQTNDFETGARGKWRNQSAHAYVDDRGLLSNYAGEDRRNFNSGVYDMLMFDWDYPDNYQQWKRTTTITQYEPNGNAIEEKSIQDIYSSAKFGYHHSVPYLTASNADYASCFFESFEMDYSGNFLEDGYQLDASTGMLYSTDAHSGKRSLKLLPSNSGLLIQNVASGSELQQQGGLLKVWIKSDRSNRDQIANELHCNAVSTGGTLLASYDFAEIARSGDWGLYESKIPAGISSGTNLRMKYDFNYAWENFLVDDVRLQPKDARVSTYVYDPATLRVVATFNDQHFGMYYQYNDEGLLVRKIQETTRGMKTTDETQYNVPELITSPW